MNIKKILTSVFAFVFLFAIITTGKEIKANDGVTTFNHNGVEYKYKNSNYVLTQEKADEMIKKQGDLIAPENDKAPEGFEHFVGYNNATHKAIYSNKKNPNELVTARASASLKISASGTWSVGSYWGTVMKDGSGIPYYCVDYGKNYPIGTSTFSKSEHTATQRALSWGAKKGDSNTAYGKTQLPYWKARGANISVTSSTVGASYWKVYQAYKGTIKENKPTLSFSGSFSKSGKFADIPNQNVTGAIKITGTASFGFNATQYKYMTDKKIYPYIYKVSTKKWQKAVTKTWYSPSAYTHLRLATTDMSKTGTVSKIEVNTTQPETAGYVWDNGKSGDQRIANYYPISTQLSAEFKAVFSAQTGSIYLLKNGDDIDLYETTMQDSSGNAIYLTKDGKQISYDDESITLDLAKYLSKEEMIEKDLFGKDYIVPIPDYEPLTETKDKLDGDGNKIAIADENGINPGEDGYIETWEQETVNVVDENGVQKVKVKKDADGKVVYIDKNLGKHLSKKEMDNIYPLAKVEFTVYDASGKEVVKKETDAKGEITFTGLLPGKYTVKETKTLENFTMITNTYSATVTAGGTVKANNGNAIMNNANFGNIEIDKVDTKGNAIEGVVFDIFDKENDELITTVITDKDGKAHFSYYEDDYYIKEVFAPEEYVMDEESKDATITNGETANVNFVNKIRFDKVFVSKVDAGDKELPGATICLERDDKSEFIIKFPDNTSKETKKYCYVSKSKKHEFSVDIGKYKLKETLPPQGFVLNTKVFDFEVTGNGAVHNEKIVNKAITTLKTGRENNTYTNDYLDFLNRYSFEFEKVMN